jgi:hypothetical protein
MKGYPSRHPIGYTRAGDHELPMRTATAEDLPELAGIISGAFLNDVDEETLGSAGWSTSPTAAM